MLAKNTEAQCKQSVLTYQTELLLFREQDDASVSAIQPVTAERRSKRRYPLALDVRYGILGGKLLSGVGQAVNLSSGGALVRSKHELGAGEELEIHFAWPSLLDGCIPIQFVATASVVRCGPSSFAVCFRRHQFRTLRSQVQPIATSVFKTPAGRRATR
jgi:hypothetical protein